MCWLNHNVWHIYWLLTRLFRADTLAGPFEDIQISDLLPEMDYEVLPSPFAQSQTDISFLRKGELTIVVGKEIKNFDDNDDPTPYLLGYTIGNDVSSRYWQRPERCGGQHAYAKSFDKFAPIGPVIASTRAIPDPTALTLTTRVNGEERQRTGTDDMIHKIPAILQFLSRGTTLKPGTIIMTGTPSGVAAFLQPPPWLRDGDVVEVEISGLGTISNRMVTG